MRKGFNMKKNSYAMLLLIFTAPLLLSGCASRESPGDNIAVNENSVDQTVAVAEKEDSSPVPKEMSLDGGYSETSTDSENVKESFGFLRKELLISHPEIYLIKVKNAETQIVAGWKIRLICEYNVGESEELHLLQAVIYKDLDQNMTLKDLKFDIDK